MFSQIGGASKLPRIKLTLSAKRSTWRINDDVANNADVEFNSIRTRIQTNRDKHSCRAEGCGFHSRRFQEVHHIDDNHHNNSEDNLVTLCPFCHAVFHIGYASINGARLIKLPDGADMLQGELNSIMRLLYVGAAKGGGELQEGCRELIASFQECSRSMIDEFGFDDPAILGDVFLRMSETEYARREDYIKGVRLLPAPVHMIGNSNRWGDRLAYWSSEAGPFGQLGTETWMTAFSNIMTVLKGERDGRQG